MVNPWLIAISVMVATFMEVIDTSIATVALPHIAGSMSATTGEATWVLTSYLVANAIILPASGWFALKFGRKRFLISCIVIFTFSSFMCGAATSLGMILVARTVQGAGGGALQPLSQAILLESFPPSRRGLAMAVFALGVVVAPILGPTLGGWLTDQYSWRWAFYVNIPIGVLAIFMLSRYVFDPPYIRDAKPGRFDGIGFGLLALSLASLQIILDKGQEVDWFGATWIRWTTLVVIATLVAFLIRELKIRAPLVDLRVFLDRNFALGCLLIALFGGVIYGLVTLLPLFYQTLLGYTALAAGLAVSPRGIGAILIMPVIGVLTGRLDNRWLIIAGFIVFAWTSIAMARLTLDISPTSLLWPIIISGCGSGMVFVPLATITMGTLKNEQMGNGSGLFNLMRNVGAGIGISTVNTLVARHQQIHRAELAQNLTPSNPAFRSVFDATRGLMSRYSGPVVADHRAYGLIQTTLDRQSAAYSYVDVFRDLALACFFCSVIVLFMKRVRPKRAGPPWPTDGPACCAMISSPVFRFLLPTENPLGFGALDFVVMGLAVLLVLVLLTRTALLSVAERLAGRTLLCMALLAALPVVLRLALLPHHPVPTPRVADDFSYLLLGDTLAHFRLANPMHPLHRFFEGVFILQDPSYSSIYPLGQGLALAFGELVFRQPVGRGGDFRRPALRALLLDAAGMDQSALGAAGRASRRDRVRASQPMDEHLLGRGRLRHRGVSGVRRAAPFEKGSANQRRHPAGRGAGTPAADAAF